MDSGPKRTSQYEKINQAITALSARLESHVDTNRAHQHALDVRITLLEASQVRRDKFEDEISAKIDALPLRMADVAAKIAEEAATKQVATCSVRMEGKKEKEQQKKKDTFGTWEWFRGRADTLIWSIVQAGALYLIVQYALTKVMTP